MSDLSGKVALVTGGSKGIGLGIMQRFVELGADVLACANDTASLAEVSGSVNGPGRVDAVEADVSSSEDMRRCVKRAKDTFGGSTSW